MKKIISLLLVVICVFTLVACSDTSTDQPNADLQNTILLAAAASLKNCMEDEIIPLFEEKNSNVKVEATYDSSGKLQTQIEEGADVDVFMSAAMKQMNALNEKSLIKDNSIVELLENKIVLIVPKDSEKEIKSFEEILNADTIAVGDPESVPAGQYAKEVFESLKIWNDVLAKSSLGTNVTEVLNWIAEGSADAGVVYSTDAASNENVQVVSEAPQGSVSKIIYPVGIVNTTTKEDSARLFVEFLRSQEVISIFEKYGFSVNK
ncbi:MAG: molybdate ABC transporter substrate-binding protein [Tissierellia bacterium]|nr:molybdate ABC transporter substrate-binding protein [Tissierellia bacterium]MDD4779757.1 molybdate ABC transporter substrate-binding protein [Tissierellia bacterium]